jgi:hypothetical protein
MTVFPTLEFMATWLQARADDLENCWNTPKNLRSEKILYHDLREFEVEVEIPRLGGSLF